MNKKVCVISLTLIILVPILIGRVNAHYKNVHRYICAQAKELYANIYGNDEISTYLVKIQDGAEHEDEKDHIYGYPWPFMTITHYWDADSGDNDPAPTGCENALQKARKLWKLAISEYNRGHMEDAYEYFGHVCHLLQDMTVPAHAHEDWHDPFFTGDDCYEDWMKNNHDRWNYSDAIDAGGFVHIPDLPGEDDPLYYLMYAANQYGDYYASDDRNGDTTDRHGWMNYDDDWPEKPTKSYHLIDNDIFDNDAGGHLSNIAGGKADKGGCFVYAIRATASLYRFFYETTHPLAHAPPNPYITKNVTIGSPAEPESADPTWACDTTSAELISAVYEPLTSLAESWTNSSDGLTFTFNMKDGVVWHDGTESTAAEMAEHAEYSFERWMIQCRSGGSTWMILQPLLGVHETELTAEFAQKIDNSVQSFTNATGSYVQFNLAFPSPLFLQTLSQPWASILNRAWTVAQGGFPGLSVTGYDPADWGAWNNPEVSELDEPTHVMMGTGPYRLDYWSPEVEWSIFWHQDYWQGWPGPGCLGILSRVTTKFIPEWETRKYMFMAGDIDFCYVPRVCIPEIIPNWQSGSWEAPENEKYLPGMFCFKDLETLTLETMFFNFNVSIESPYLGPNFDPNNPYTIAQNRIPRNFFEDIDVRKGFASAFDYDTYIRQVYYGEASYNPTPVLEGLPYHNPDQDGYHFDLVLAKQHFMEAWGGQVWTNGFTFTITRMTGNEVSLRACDMLKTNVESLNGKFHISISEVSWPEYQKALNHRWLPLFMLDAVAGYPDPHILVFPFMHSHGTFAYFQSYHNATVDDLVEQGMQTNDTTGDYPERNATYHALQGLYVEDCPSVPLARPLARHWGRIWMMGWSHNPTYLGYYGSGLPARGSGTHFYRLWKGYLGDVDRNGDIDLEDLYHMLQGYGMKIRDAMKIGVPPSTDVDQDGMIDMDDLYFVVIQYLYAKVR